jgi:hypothetical protein
MAAQWWAQEAASTFGIIFCGLRCAPSVALKVFALFGIRYGRDARKLSAYKKALRGGDLDTRND